jgi:hypothetical protein
MTQDTIVPINPDKLKLLYEAIVLEQALVEVCKARQADYHKPPNQRSSSSSSNIEAFQGFLDKLAQVCDNQRGGKTVTAFSVLDDLDGVEYIFGSNDREHSERLKVQEFAESLLTLVGKSNSDLQGKGLKKKVLWKILLFNFPRIEAYLTTLLKVLDKCLAECRDQHLQAGMGTQMFVLQDAECFVSNSHRTSRTAKELGTVETTSDFLERH